MGRGRPFGYLFFVRYWPAWSELPEGVVQQCDSLPEARNFQAAAHESGIAAEVERLLVTPLAKGVNITVERVS